MKSTVARTFANGVAPWLHFWSLLLLPASDLLAQPFVPQLAYYDDGYGGIIIGGNFESRFDLSILNIPATIDDLPVKAIAPNAFVGFRNLMSVTIPNTVTEIGDSAFVACTNLTNMTIPDSLTRIGDFAFSGCSSLRTMTIPKSVTEIGKNAFQECTGLTLFLVDDGNPAYSSVEGVLHNKTQTTLIKYPPAKLDSSYSIPNKVTSIASDAFGYSTNLIGVMMPDSVTSIGEYAFTRCLNLARLDIPNSVTSIGPRAFTLCTRLLTVTMPNKLTFIATGLFEGCFQLRTVTIPNNVTYIGSYAFSQCGQLTHVTIGNSVTTVRDFAFYLCFNLEAVYFQSTPPPRVGPGAFGTSPVAIFYHAGTTGWESTFAGHSAFLWNPQVSTATPDFGIKDGKFGFSFSGLEGTPVGVEEVVVVEACDDLANPVWRPVGTNTLTGGYSLFSDATSVTHPSRIYRLRSPY